MTLTCDHRAIDGATALRSFLRTVRRSSRSPAWPCERRGVSVWYHVRDLDAGRASTATCSASGRPTSTGRPLGAARARRDGDRARRGRATRAASPRSTSTTSRPRPSGCAAAGVEVGDVARAARPDAAPRRLRPGRQPHPARRSSRARDPPGGARRTSRSCGTCSATPTTRAGATEADVAARPLRRRLGPPGRHGADRARRVQPVGAAWYRLFEPRRAGVRLRRRADARAHDRGRPEPTRPRLGDAAARRRCSTAPARRATSAISLSVEPDNPAHPAVRAPRLRKVGRASRCDDHARGLGSGGA